MTTDAALPQPETMTVEAAIQKAIAHHQAGELQDAERLYRSILQARPNHPDANHNLGVLAVQLNQPAAGLSHFKAALNTNPNIEQYWLSYIDALIQAGDTDAACQVLEKGQQGGLNGKTIEALVDRLKMKGINPSQCGKKKPALKPSKQIKPLGKSIPNNGKCPSHHEMSLLVSLFNQRRFDETVAAAKTMTNSFPMHAFGWKVLGAVYKQIGQSEKALAPMQKAAALLRSDAETFYNLATTLHDLGRLDEAKDSYHKALEIKPDYAEVHNNLCNTLMCLGQLHEAEASCHHALDIKSDYAEAHYNLGCIFDEQGRLEDAVVSYHRAVEIKRDYVDAHNNLGNTLSALGYRGEAETSYRVALVINPDYANAHSNLGKILYDLDRFDEAKACYRRALEIKPNFAATHNNLGVLLKDLGDLDEAVLNHRYALQIMPDFVEAHSGLLFALNYHPDKSIEEIFASYQEYDNRFGLPHRLKWQTHSNCRNIHRRLKVGYVSPDFRRHSVQYFLEPLLAHHDKDFFEVYAYAELHCEDALTARYQRYVDHWIPTLGMSDVALAARIRNDRIDILVDLAGHTAKNRLSVFARKPTPVSVSWLGFGYTTGLTAIDYLLTDIASSPEGSERFFSEYPWRIETPNYAYRPSDGMGATGSLPAIKQNYVTFGTLTRAVRINHHTIRVWSEILKRIKNSRLVIDSRNFQSTAMQDALAAKFAAHGIDIDRLEIGYHSPPWEVLRRIDITLDCFPHNSGTTLFESLYMGIPFVTLAGRPSVGRLGSSILVGLGHPEWIARTESEYIEIAVMLASDLSKLAFLRAGLRSEMEASPLMDELGFSRRVETAFRDMFERWATGTGKQD